MKMIQKCRTEWLWTLQLASFGSLVQSVSVLFVLLDTFCTAAAAAAAVLRSGPHQRRVFFIFWSLAKFFFGWVRSDSYLLWKWTQNLLHLTSHRKDKELKFNFQKLSYIIKKSVSTEVLVNKPLSAQIILNLTLETNVCCMSLKWLLLSFPYM